MNIRTTMLTLVTGLVISISGSAAAHASVSTATGHTATFTKTAVTLAADDGQDPWPKP